MPEEHDTGLGGELENLYPVTTTGASTTADIAEGMGFIPGEQALEIRRLSHDLSNALEIVVQTSYLVGTLQLEPHARQWVQMLDEAVKKALTLNSELRGYIQQNSRGGAERG